MNLFSVLIKKANLFDTSCEYKSRCPMYKMDSYICAKEVDKSYCGIYKQFSQEDLKPYKPNLNIKYDASQNTKYDRSQYGIK